MNVAVDKAFIIHSQYDQIISLSRESEDILQRIKKIGNNCFFYNNSILISKLKKIKPIEMTEILNCFFSELIQKGDFKDFFKIFDRLAELIPLERLEKSVKDNVHDTLEEAKGMFEEAKLYLEIVQDNASPSIKVRISSVLDGLIAITESVIAAFGIGDFFKPSESELHADSKPQRIMMLMSMFGMLTTMILPILGAASGGLIIGGILLCTTALSIIWPYIRPTPSHLPANAENWTKQIQRGGFVAQGRKESLDEIAKALKMNRHAILVGPSRIGKSLTAKAFALEIDKYSELKGKKVFRINTADIVDQKASFLGGGNNILNRISEAMGRHRREIVLVFDEIHMACKGNDKIADQFKTFLDEDGEFPYVIGITTDLEYEKYVKENHAFALRFDRIDIKSTSKDETLKILCDIISKSHSKPFVEEGALAHIYDESIKIDKDAPQPTASIKILKRCISKTEKTQKSTTESKIAGVSNKILSLRSQLILTNDKKTLRLDILELEKQLIQLQKALSNENEELNKLFKAKEMLNLVRKETYSTVLKLSKVGQTALNSKEKRHLSRFLLLSEFLSSSLQSHIKLKSLDLGVNVMINDALINEVVGA